MTNYAFPAHDVKRSGYCPKLASQLSLTTPIKASEIRDIEIDTDAPNSSAGLPLLSNMHESLKNDKTILTFDKMTMHFDKLIHSLLADKNTKLITSVYG
jgi:hypothetical protein